MLIQKIARRFWTWRYNLTLVSSWYSTTCSGLWECRQAPNHSLCGRPLLPPQCGVEAKALKEVRVRRESSWAEPGLNPSLPFLTMAPSAPISCPSLRGGPGLAPPAPTSAGGSRAGGAAAWEGGSICGVIRSEGFNLIPILHYPALISNHIRVHFH